MTIERPLATAALRLLMLLATTALTLGVGGCASHQPRNDRAGAPPTRTARLYSPNGEPLNGGPLGHPTCEVAMAGWFERVDTDHDGSVSQQEFLADATTQFDRMDLDHDGFLTPAKLSQFRAPYDTDTEGQSDARPKPGRRGPRTASLPEINADPVMSADTSLRFRVSRDDFQAQARRVFAELDTGHHGALSRENALKTCPKSKS